MTDPQSAISDPRARRRRVAVLLCLPVAAAVIGAALVWHYNRLPREFAAVEPGVLYRSSQPTPSQLKKAVKDFGIKTVLIARESSSERVTAEVEAARRLGLNIEQVPLVSSVPPTDDQMARFFEIVDNPANRPVLVHCSQGRHRTGYLCGLYRIERQDWSVAKALEEMESFCADEKGPHAMITLLRQYKPRSERSTP